jgi:cell division protein FtsB
MGRLVQFRKRRAAPTDARTDTLFPSDACPTDELPPGKAPDPDAERRRKFRQGVVGLVVATAFVGGSAAALVGSRGYLDVRRSREELALLKAETDKKQDDVTLLKKEVDRLKSDPRALERIAREELGFARPGEVTILLPFDEDRGPGARLLFPPPALKKTPGGAPAVPRD